MKAAGVGGGGEANRSDESSGGVGVKSLISLLSAQHSRYANQILSVPRFRSSPGPGGDSRGPSPEKELITRSITGPAPSPPPLLLPLLLSRDLAGKEMTLTN